LKGSFGCLFFFRSEGAMTTNEVSGLDQLLRSARTIAVVGLSAKEQQPSHEVAQYLQANGYRIIPVNPKYAGTHILGEHCYPTLSQAAQAVSAEAGPIDIVDCFRRSEHIDAVVDEAIAIGARCIWMQLGVSNEHAAQKARSAGLQVVMNKCIKSEHWMHVR
jgi:uncharacterized protein